MTSFRAVICGGLAGSGIGPLLAGITGPMVGICIGLIMTGVGGVIVTLMEIYSEQGHTS